MSSYKDIEELKQYFKNALVTTNFKKDVYKESFKVDIKLKGNDCFLFVLIAKNFPYDRPVVHIHPPFESSLIGKEGEVKLNEISIWNYKSNLLQTILNTISALDINYTSPQKVNKNNDIYNYESPDKNKKNFSNFNDNNNPYNFNKLNNNFSNVNNYNVNNVSSNNSNYNHGNSFSYSKNNDNSNNNNNNSNSSSSNNIMNSSNLNKRANFSNSFHSALSNDKRKVSNNEDIIKMQLVNTELSKEENLKATLDAELRNKSVEELLLVYFNQEEFVNKLTFNLKKENIELIDQINNLKSKKINYLI